MLDLTPLSSSPLLRRSALALLILFAMVTAAPAHAQDLWTPVGPMEPLVGVLVDPLDSSTLYVRGDLRGLSKSTDGGLSWTPIHEGLTENGVPPWVAALAINPLDPRVLYAAVHFPQPPFDDRISRLFKTVDGGLHWTPISSPADVLVEIRRGCASTGPSGSSP